MHKAEAIAVRMVMMVLITFLIVSFFMMFRLLFGVNKRGIGEWAG